MDVLGDSWSSDNCPAPEALLACKNKVRLSESEDQRAEGRVSVVVSKDMHKFIQRPRCKLPLLSKVCSKLPGKNGLSLLPDLWCALGESSLHHLSKAGTYVKKKRLEESQGEPSACNSFCLKSRLVSSLCQTARGKVSLGLPG